MRRRYGGAELYRAEILPTDEGGTYTFCCGTVWDEEGHWIRSAVCKETPEVPRGPDPAG